MVSLHNYDTINYINLYTDIPNAKLHVLFAKKLNILFCKEYWFVTNLCHNDEQNFHIDYLV